LDELTTSTTSHVWTVGGGEVVEESFDPARLGITPAADGALTGGDADFNADVFRRVIGGEKGAVRDAVVLNAAAGIAAFEATSEPLEDRLAHGLERASESIDSGSAARVLEAWIAATAEAI
jgi:anthranilate phosphoribosyltransferase